PTVPAPMITTSVGGTPLMLPNIKPLPPLTFDNNSDAIKIEAVPAISLNALTAGYAPSSSLINSKAKAVMRFEAKVSKYFLDCVFNCNAEINKVCGLMSCISSNEGGSTFNMIGQE